MKGYNPEFLEGINIPLPEFTPELDGAVLIRPTLKDGKFADYINYTVVMNETLKTPIFVALNIYQADIRSTARSRWRLDSRIGDENQLDDDYYRNNPWDKGHMARRATSSWGSSQRAAQQASDDTMYYSNSCLQHANLNQDEWLALEEWVKNLELDEDGKITSISGPVYGELNRTLKPQGRAAATIPAGFFKIVAFKNKVTKALDVRAFLMYQDHDAISDKRGKRHFNNQTYQVTITEIEQLTGLKFSDNVFESNSAYYYDSEKARDINANVPEHIEISHKDAILDATTKRTKVRDIEADVFIAAAMINPRGNERENEWVSIINLSPSTIDLKGWKLQNLAKKTVIIGDGQQQSVLLESGESLKIRPITPLTLLNRGDVIELFDDKGARIDRVKYLAEEVRNNPENTPILFLEKRRPSVTDKALFEPQE